MRKEFIPSIKVHCPLCGKLETVEAFACVHEYDCSVDYVVQCLNSDCMHECNKRNCFSPSTIKHFDTIRKAINAWNRGEISEEKRIGGGCYSNYMGD
jgi:hypothetical protein